jgi:hypothetical protein
MHRRQKVSYVITKEPATVRLRDCAATIVGCSKNRTWNCNHYIEMYEVVNPEIPGLDGSNPGISGLRKSPGSRDSGSRDCNPSAQCLNHLSRSLFDRDCWLRRSLLYGVYWHIGLFFQNPESLYAGRARGGGELTSNPQLLALTPLQSLICTAGATFSHPYSELW